MIASRIHLEDYTKSDEDKDCNSDDANTNTCTNRWTTACSTITVSVHSFSSFQISLNFLEYDSHCNKQKNDYYNNSDTSPKFWETIDSACT